MQIPEVTCVRVGYGVVAKIHEQKLKEFGVKTIGIVETDIEKRKQATQDGYQVFSSCAEAAKLQPFFWDICVNTNHHFQIMKSIMSFDNYTNIIVEKPICLYSEIAKLKDILSEFRGQIVVNENYYSSNVIYTLKNLAFHKFKITPQKLVVEFTKNRYLDMLEGRFIDNDLGVIGYEGSHMLAIILEMGEEYWPEPDKIVEAETTEGSFFTKVHKKNDLMTPGRAHIKWKSKSGIDVIMYTSMAGQVQYQYEPFSPLNSISISQRERRHRIVAIHGNDILGNQYILAGFLEPISGFSRSEGAVVITKNGEILDIIAPIHDDCMGTHLGRSVKYFKDAQENPCSVETSVKITEMLHLLVEKMCSFST